MLDISFFFFFVICKKCLTFRAKVYVNFSIKNILVSIEAILKSKICTSTKSYVGEMYNTLTKIK